MSRDNKSLQETLAELKLQFNSPITLQLIKNDFIDRRESLMQESWNNETTLKEYLMDVMDSFFKVIQLENIVTETSRIEGFIKEIRKEKYVKFDVFENGNWEEANKLLKDIYTKWNDVQLRKELCSDHMVLIKKAIMYLSSLKKVIFAFMQEDQLHMVKFHNLAESKRFIEAITVSIDSYVEVLKNQITELSAWIDNTLSAKVNLLMRTESSLRLLAKYAEWDKDYNNGCGDTEQKKYGGSGDFNLEKV